MPGKPCFTLADRILIVAAHERSGDRGEREIQMAESVALAGGAVVEQAQVESASHCVVERELWESYSQGLSAEPALERVMRINAGRATDFSAPTIHVLPMLWLTASLSLGLKIPESTHSLLIPHPAPAPDPPLIPTRALAPLGHSHHNIPSSSRSRSPPSPIKKQASPKAARSRSTMDPAKQRDQWEKVRAREAEVRLREQRSEVPIQVKEELVRGWLGADGGAEGGVQV